MGGDPFQHIPALSYVNNLIVKLDAVNTGVFILRRKPSPAQHGTNIFYILVLHFLPPFISFFALQIYYNIIFNINQKSPLFLDFSQFFTVFRM